VTWIKKRVSSQTISSLDFSKNDKKNKTKNPKVRPRKLPYPPLKFATNLNFCLRKDFDLGKLVNIHTVPSL